MSLEDDLREAVDRYKIESVIYQYCRAIDRVDVNLWKDVYWPDALHNHGAFDGNAWDFIDFAAPQVKRFFAITQHNITNINYEICGDVAHTESYLIAFHRISASEEIAPQVFGLEYAQAHKGAADYHDYILIARYLDRFERRSGRWRIARRTAVQDWNINQPGTALFNDALVNVITRRSTRDRSDLSYSHVDQAN